MSNTSNIAGINTSVQVTNPVTSASAASGSSTVTKPLTQISTTSISPRIVSDPSAGIIIQYLNSSGQVENQIPSSTVVAYLRAGLTAQGYPRSQGTQA